MTASCANSLGGSAIVLEATCVESVVVWVVGKFAAALTGGTVVLGGHRTLMLVNHTAVNFSISIGLTGTPGATIIAENSSDLTGAYIDGALILLSVDALTIRVSLLEV